MTDRIDPRRTALLVMDYQNGILDRPGAPDELLSQAAEAIASPRQAGVITVADLDGMLSAG